MIEPKRLSSGRIKLLHILFGKLLSQLDHSVRYSMLNRGSCKWKCSQLFSDLKILLLYLLKRFFYFILEFMREFFCPTGYQFVPLDSRVPEAKTIKFE